MYRSSITRKLLPARTALGKLATALRLGGFRLRPSKAFKRTASGISVGVSAILGGRRRPPSRFRLKSRPPLRLPSDQSLLLHRRSLPPPELADDLSDKPVIPVHVEPSLELDTAAGAVADETGVSEPRQMGSAEEKLPGTNQLEGIDLRAELFIAAFREKMREESQRSSDDRLETLSPGL
ncbi:unnamed protein product [Spirodela intermedia]|uniref:Uncharacterized protein n=1 Tax=Spirodela intermedia TaxID=51605 RepID=A0A7I8L1Q0_SPIIN|nr:unnamed protein product [Spirodela intermedia]